MKANRFAATGKLLKFYLRLSKVLTLLLCLLPFLFAYAAAQIAPHARLARGISFGILAVFLIWQMIANTTGNENLLLLSPLGWCAWARPYAGENFLLFLFAPPAIILLTVVAWILSGRRDLGGCYLRERTAKHNAAA